MKAKIERVFNMDAEDNGRLLARRGLDYVRNLKTNMNIKFKAFRLTENITIEEFGDVPTNNNTAVVKFLSTDDDKSIIERMKKDGVYIKDIVMNDDLLLLIDCSKIPIV